MKLKVACKKCRIFAKLSRGKEDDYGKKINMFWTVTKSIASH